MKDDGNLTELHECFELTNAIMYTINNNKDKLDLCSSHHGSLTFLNSSTQTAAAAILIKFHVLYVVH